MVSSLNVYFFALSISSTTFFGEFFMASEDLKPTFLVSKVKVVIDMACSSLLTLARVPPSHDEVNIRCHRDMRDDEKCDEANRIGCLLDWSVTDRFLVTVYSSY
ncbi:hypothetical protein ACFE04_013490 [Oxalis oulophora]